MVLRFRTFSTFYDICVKNSAQETQTMSEYKGKLLLIVNVASKWGATKREYSELVQIEKEFSPKGLQILAFPCNQFGGQEPGTDEEILTFIRSTGALFPVFSKVKVNGPDACELYKYLRNQSELKGGKIGWNFSKFIVSQDSTRIQYFGHKVHSLEVAKTFKDLL